MKRIVGDAGNLSIKVCCLGGLMQPAKTLFTMGSKRSGTSLLVQLLNLHERVFVSHESDVAWILYQCRNGLPDTFHCYPWDRPVGMCATLDSAGRLLRVQPNRPPSRENLLAAFFDVQRHLMQHGSAVQPRMDKPHVEWIGDKKPAQHCDPAIRAFVSDLSPDARYLHLVRHPGPVMASMELAGSWRPVPAYWKAGTASMIQRWVLHEEQVLIAKEVHKQSVLTLRYEDLLFDPVAQMKRCFKHLQLSVTDELTFKINSMTKKDNLAKKTGIPARVSSPKLKSLMDLYGYELDGTVRSSF